MPKLKQLLSGNRKRPEMVTGSFGLEYEDLVKRNRYMIIALVGVGILTASMVVPFAVYRSLAGTPVASFEPENSAVSSHVAKGTDAQASAGGYVQFNGPNATMALTLSSNSVTIGNTVDVTVRINTADKIVAAQSYVTFDSARLQFMASDYTGSPLTTDLPDSATGTGFVSTSRYSTTPSTGSAFTLVKLTFKSLVSGGSTTIGITKANSGVYDNTSTGDNILTTVSNSTLSQ